MKSTKTVLVQMPGMKDPIEMTYSDGDNFQLPDGAKIVTKETPLGYVKSILKEVCIKRERVAIEWRLANLDSIANEKVKIIEADLKHSIGEGDSPHNNLDEARLFKNHNYELLQLFANGFRLTRQGKTVSEIKTALAGPVDQLTKDN